MINTQNNTLKTLDFNSDWKKLLELSKEKEFLLSLVQEIKSINSESFKDYLGRQFNVRFCIFWNRFNNNIVTRVDSNNLKDLSSFNADFDFISWFPVLGGSFFNDEIQEIIIEKDLEKAINKVKEKTGIFLSEIQSMILDYKTNENLEDNLFLLNGIILPIDLLKKDHLGNEFLRFSELLVLNPMEKDSGYFVGRRIQTVESRTSKRLILDNNGELIFPYCLLEKEILNWAVDFFVQKDKQALFSEKKIAVLDFIYKRKDLYPDLVPEFIKKSNQFDLEIEIILEAIEFTLFEWNRPTPIFLHSLIDSFSKIKTEKEMEFLLEKILLFLKARKNRQAFYHKLLPEFIYKKTYENDFNLVEVFDDSELEDLKERALIIYSPFSNDFFSYLNKLDISKLRLFLKKNNVKIHKKTKKKIKTTLLNKKMKWKLSKRSRVFLEKLLELEEIR
jgi:hypothetical protein